MLLDRLGFVDEPARVDIAAGESFSLRATIEFVSLTALETRSISRGTFVDVFKVTSLHLIECEQNQTAKAEPSSEGLAFGEYSLLRIYA